MIIIIEYREERDEDGLIYIISEEENLCPLCLGILVVIGSRKRHVINCDDQKATLVIRRFFHKNLVFLMDFFAFCRKLG